jgi:dephospho-CoA kinase
VRIIGLTGGIGMGKSTAAAAFRRSRIPVFDADMAVHQLQARGGRAVKAIEAAYPGTTRNGAVDRAALRHAVLGNPEALTRLEHILHPMVEAEERAFVARARRHGRSAVVLDIPLMFEVKGDKRVDTVVVVSAPLAVQIQRVGKRRRMTKADVAAIIARQMPDAEKRRRADLVVKTGLSRAHTLRILRRFIQGLAHEPHRPLRH